MNAVIYCRVSSREQVEGTSLESQEVACRDYARQKHFTILKVFRGQGESAKVADRPELVELLNYCKQKQHGVEILLVWKLDRFARNVEDHYAIKAILKQRGVVVVSVTEPIDSAPTGRLMETMLAGFAQFDNDIRATRTKLGMQQRLQDGIYPWKPPLGYLPPHLDKKTEPDRPDPDRFALLRRAWLLYASGAYNKAAILRMLRSWGVRGYRGGTLCPDVLDKILANPFYAGILRDPWTGQEHVGRHAPMVSASDFYRVQRIIGRSNRSVPHVRFHPEFPLRGHVRCPSCHNFLTATFAHGARDRYPYYDCHRQGCSTRRKSYSAATVHGEFETHLVNSTVSPTVAGSILEAMLVGWRKGCRTADARRAKQLREIKDAEKRLSELIRMRSAQLISDNEFAAHRDSVRIQLERAYADLPESGVRPLEPEDAEDAVHWFSDLRGLWAVLSIEQQHAFVSSMFRDGYVLTSSRTTNPSLLFRILGRGSDRKTCLVPLSETDTNTFFQELRGFLAIVPKRLLADKATAEDNDLAKRGTLSR